MKLNAYNNVLKVSSPWKTNVLMHALTKLLLIKKPVWMNAKNSSTCNQKAFCAKSVLPPKY